MSLEMLTFNVLKLKDEYKYTKRTQRNIIYCNCLRRKNICLLFEKE